MRLILTLLAGLCASAAIAQTAPGVTKNEIVIGTLQDLSGPLAGYGKQIRNGMLMRVEEANETGGINGRKIKLLIEDDGYDPKKAVLAAQKLVTQEPGIFAMVGHLGTAPNMAAMPVQFDKGVINFFPITAAREMYEPLNKLAFANAATYFDHMRVGVPRLAQDTKVKKACLLY